MSSNTPIQGSGDVELRLMPSFDNVWNIEEDWTGVTSTAERRRLQNRLNQRAYRKRHKRVEARETVSAITAATEEGQKETTASTSTDKISLQSLSSDEARRLKGNRCLDGQIHRKAAIRLFAQLAYESYRRGALEPTHLPILIQYNVHSALLRNAEMLGLSDMWHNYHAVSPFYGVSGTPGTTTGTPSPPPELVTTTVVASPDWPATLRPTALQRRLEHHPWIDLFPLPRMRDNVLLATAAAIPNDEIPSRLPVCDEDELCYDLAQFGDVNKPCLIVWGAPWDPRSWEASLPMLRKWGWLLEGCGEILEATNHWRERRGEKRFTRKEFEDMYDESLKRAQRLSMEVVV